MKGFIASIITLSLLIGAVIWNGIWIQKTVGELIDIVSSIPEDADEESIVSSCRDLSDKWNSHRRILCISVSHTEVETIAAEITALTVFAEKGTKPEFAATLASLKDKLSYLKKSEALSLEGII